MGFPELPAAEPLSAADYLAARESLLRARPHVALSEAAGLFQQKLCEAYGGGMFRFDGGLFCAYRDGDRWMIPELLPDDAALPVPAGFSAATKPYLCSDLPFPEGCLWNLTFD